MIWMLQFSAFYTEENQDVVDVYVGGLTVAGSRHAAALSGHLPSHRLPTIASTNNLLILTFTSDSSMANSGFQAEFTTGQRVMLSL